MHYSLEVVKSLNLMKQVLRDILPSCYDHFKTAFYTESNSTHYNKQFALITKNELCYGICIQLNHLEVFLEMPKRIGRQKLFFLTKNSSRNNIKINAFKEKILQYNFMLNVWHCFFMYTAIIKTMDPFLYTVGKECFNVLIECPALLS